MNRKNINYFVDLGLVFTFLASFGTGIIKVLVKYPEILRFLGIRSLRMHTISRVHDLSGVLMGTLVLIHLLLHWRWLFTTTKKMFRRNKKLSSVSLIAGLLVVSGCIGEEKEEPVKELEGVDIEEYEGEKLTPLSVVRTTSIKGPQYVDSETYTLKITGLVETTRELTYEDVLAYQNYSKVVSLNCVEGWSITILWEGVLVKDFLDFAGITEGANTVIFYAYDGYSTSLSLNYIVENNILMAYKMNDVVLTPEMGFPFQLVAEDKWGYKWIKWVTTIEVSDDLTYRGYWERRGYSQDGDDDGPMLEGDESQ